MPAESGAVELEATALTRSLAEADTPEARAWLANRALADKRAVSRPGDLALGERLWGALDAARRRDDATVATLLEGIGQPSGDDVEQLELDRERLSDTLVAALYASERIPSTLAALEDLFHAYAALGDDGGRVAEPLGAYLRRPLGLPQRPARRDRPDRGGERRAADGRLESPAARAAAELFALDRAANLVQPADGGVVERGRVPFTLALDARQRLSDETRKRLDEAGIDLDETPVDVAVTLVSGESELDGADRIAGLPAPVIELPTTTADPGGEPLPAPAPTLRPAGIADLLVVKQQLKRYDRSDIAHVENVLAGEKKSRSHRALERTEETFTTETESLRERETELETADRFELNRETSRTLKEDQQIGTNLTLSGKYGPTVEFSSSLEMSASSASEESAKNASRFARDVVQRSLERVVERLREERVQRIIRESEEVNLHELANDDGEHVSGVYQFLEKVYEAQVFNYGVRQMFDFMVPEPASFLWYVERNPSAGVSLPPPPAPLESYAPNASYLTAFNYRALAARYGATDVEPPPPLYQRVGATLKHGEDDASESGQPRSVNTLELTIPDGYALWRATVQGQALTDEDPVIGVTVADRNLVWRPSAADRVDLSSGFELGYRPTLSTDFSAAPIDPAPDSKLAVNVVAFETNLYTLNVVLVCRRLDRALEQWQLATYAKIRAAYEDRLREHQQRVTELEAEAEARAQAITPFGAPPAQNRVTVREELKKHCISILTRQRFDDIDATQDGQPPFFDFDEAAEEGAVVRFFEQAFEWDQMQFVFYPYFWARKETWVDRFVKQDPDPEFRDFLRAGAARVVVPVRPRFDEAVLHFLETGKLWGGDGEPPVIASPLYVSIVDEIRERTGAPEGEIPTGEPWDVRVPTPLVLLRGDASLPTWTRESPDGWQWRADEPAAPAEDGDGG